MKERLLFLSVVGLSIAIGCMNDPTPPVTAVPRGTGCASLAIACFDEFARQPAKIICFREASRWDRTNLTWRIGSYFDALSQEGQDEAAEDAFELWADASSLSFTRITSGSADITIDFVAGEHGDDFPFDGPGEILGHAFFPGSGNPGQIHLCNEEQWALSPGDGQFDLFTGLVHEIGHALGLEHSLDDDAVMAPNYMEGIDELDDDDIEAIQRLYGAPGEGLPPLMPTDAEFAAFCADAGMNLTALDDPDTDEDGIPDTYERFVLDTDPVGGDTDDDGSDDFVEIFIDRTDPLDLSDFIPQFSSGDAEVSVDVFVDCVLRTQYRSDDAQTQIFSSDASETDVFAYQLSLSRFDGTVAAPTVDVLTLNFGDTTDLDGTTQNLVDLQVFVTYISNIESDDALVVSWFNICDPSFPSEACEILNTQNLMGVGGTFSLQRANMRVFGSFDISGPGMADSSGTSDVRIVGTIDVPEQLRNGTTPPSGTLPMP